MNIRRKRDAEDALHHEAQKELSEIERVRWMTEEQRKRLLYLENLMRLTILKGDEVGESRS